MLHLFNVFREHDGKENCAQVLKEELHRMLGIEYVNDEHDCNVLSMNSLNTHDANDMQSHKLGDAIFDEDDLFSSSTLNDQNHFDESMPPIYDDYYEGTYALKKRDDKTFHTFKKPFAKPCFFIVDTICSAQVFYDTPTTILENRFPYVQSSKIYILVDHEKNALGAGYIVEFIHDATENYYERGSYASTYCNSIKLPLHMLKFLKLCLFCLPMLVDSCSNKLFDHKIPMRRKWVRLKSASHMLHDALVVIQSLPFM